jgi:hypothetical protein
MADFSSAERADRWLGIVRDWIYDRAHAVGTDAWNSGPAQRESRERACRILVAAVKRREREITRLGAAGVPGTAVRVRLNTERAHHRARARS